jgi:serine/threonine-protein kinase
VARRILDAMSSTEAAMAEPPTSGGEPASDPLLPRRTLADRYVIERELGRGGMATVYLATDLRHQRLVALKVLRAEVASQQSALRFLREIRITCRLVHPHILTLHDSGEAEGRVYCARPYLPGATLRRRVARAGRLALHDAVRLTGEVADALAYAHAHGVVHRDIKPDNIMLDRATGRAVVTDFGIARAAAGDSRLTVTGVAIGTPAYMSPEQALGEREVDGRSDIYSLGIIAYQMLAGEPPFKASNTPAMLVKHVSETPRPLALMKLASSVELNESTWKPASESHEIHWPGGGERPAAGGAAEAEHDVRDVVPAA